MSKVLYARVDDELHAAIAHLAGMTMAGVTDRLLRNALGMSGGRDPFLEAVEKVAARGTGDER